MKLQNTAQVNQTLFLLKDMEKTGDDYCKDIILKHNKLLKCNDLAVLLMYVKDEYKLIHYKAKEDKFYIKSWDMLQLKKRNFNAKNNDLNFFRSFFEEETAIDLSQEFILSSINKNKHNGIITGLFKSAIDHSIDGILLKLMAEQLLMALEIKSNKKQITKTQSELSFLVEINRLVNSGEKYETIISSVLDKLSAILDAESGGILLYEKEQNRLDLQKPAFGIDDEQLFNNYRISIAAEGVFTSGKPYISNNTPADPLLIQEYVQLFGVCNTMSVPLQVENRIIGVVHIINKKKGIFTDNDVRLLSIFASQIAGLIEKISLFEEVMRQEQETNTLFEISLDISSTLDIDILLDKIVARSCFLLKCEMSAIALIDNARQGYLKAVNGPIDRFLKNKYIETDKGITGIVLDRKTPITLNLNSNYSNYLHETKRGEFEAYLSLEGYRSIVAIPLGNADICGVLFCCRKNDMSFTKKNVNLLSRMSNQISIALEKVKLYEQKEKTVLELKQSNKVIEDHRVMLKKSLEIHEVFTKTILHNNGFQAVANTLFKLIRCPVIVLDKYFKRLVYSIGTDSMVDDFYINRISHIVDIDEVKASLEEVRIKKNYRIFPPLPQYGLKRPTLFAPIVGSDGVEGYTIVVLKDREPNELDIVAIEHATSVFALEMVKKKIVYEVEKKLKGDYLDDLLTGKYNNEEEVLERVNYLGFDLSQPNHQVMVVKINYVKDNIHEMKKNKIKNSILELIDNLIKKKAPSCIAVTKGELIVLISNVNDICTPFDLANALYNMINDICGTVKVNIGIGSDVYKLEDFHISYEEAKRSSIVLSKYSKNGGVILYKDLGVYTLLGQIGSKDLLETYVNNSFGALIIYDKKKNTNFVDTLKIYLENNTNIQQTSRDLFLHANSLNYRIKRIQEVLNVDLKKSDERLKLLVAFKAYEMIKE
ncbi:MAG: GAF domain-containing protein [Bacillota bacterium]|nr:GAF domain-containing protein [Bacillota bacterium]